mgnify:CR=1 FL=1
MIATLNQLQRRLNLDAGVDEERLTVALWAAATQIERLAGRHFEPRIKTLVHPVVCPTEILLRDDLLEVHTIVDNNGVVITDTTLIPQGDSAASVLQKDEGFSGELLNITGIWGWHDAWSTAWRDSQDTVQSASISPYALNIIIEDVLAPDILGETPRFMVGHLIRVDDEFMRVLAVDTANAILRVQRGVNGSTAVSHDEDTPIYTYQPPADIAALVVRWAAWLYREPDQRTPTGIPSALMKELAIVRRM